MTREQAPRWGGAHAHSGKAWLIMKAGVSAEVRALFDLLLAEDWLAKCDLVGRERALLPAVRAILRDEARTALARGDEEDASIFAAHASLLDDIERRGLGPVQAEIIRAMAWASRARPRNG